MTETRVEQSDFKYDVFISYRRKDGGLFANWIRQRLVAYRLPSAFGERSRRRLQVYQDTTYEQATEDFWNNTIQPALLASRHLAVVMTPGLLEPATDGQPNWVEREITAFLSAPQGRNVFVLQGADTQGDRLPSALEHFPRIERVDIRDVWPPWKRLLKRSPLRAAMLTIAATLYGVLPEEMPLLRQEEERRKRRRASVVAAVSTLLLLVVSGLALSWLFERNEARKQRDLAIARQLAAQSQFILADDPARIEQSVLLAVESIRRVHLIENDAAIRRGLSLLLRRIGNIPTAADTLAFDSRSRFVAIAGEDHVVRVVELPGGRELKRLEHPAAVLSLAVSPDGRYLATGCADSQLRVFDSTSGAEISRVRYAVRVLSVNFSPNGRYLAIGLEDESPTVVETSGWKGVLRLPHDSAVTSIAYSPDGRYLAARSGNASRVFDLENAKDVSRATGHAPFDAVALATGGRYLDNHTLYDARTGNEVATLPGTAVHASALSADGTSVAVCGGLASRDMKCALYRPSSPFQELVRLPAHTNVVAAIEYSPDGRYVATTSQDGTIRVFETTDGREAGIVPGRGREKFAFMFSPDSQYLAVRTGTDTNIYALLTDIVLLTGRGASRSVSFSADGSHLAHSGRAEVVDIRKNKIVPVAGVGPASAVALSADGRYVAVATSDAVQVFEVASGKPVFRRNKTDPVRVQFQVLAFSADGGYLAIGNQGSVRVIRLSDGSELRLFDGFKELRAVAFSPALRYFAAGDRMGGHVFLVETGKKVLSVSHGPNIVHSVTFSRDGRYFASGSLDKMVRVVDLVSDKRFELSHETTVFAIDFSPDSRYIATGGFDKTARIFELSSRQEMARFNHQNSVLAVAFSDGGRSLTTVAGPPGNSDPRSPVAISRHVLRSEDLVHDACSRLTRDLTFEEWRTYLGEEKHKTCRELLASEPR